MRPIPKIFVFLFFLISCESDGTDIREFNFREINFENMPIEVQETIFEFYKQQKTLRFPGDSLSKFGAMSDLVCLDSKINHCEYKLVWSKLVGGWLDHKELLIEHKKIIIEQSVNDYNEPYILFDGLLYCRTNFYVEDYRNPSKDDFKVIEINKN